MEGLERIAGMPNMVVVDFGLLSQNDPVPRAELIGFALSRCAYTTRTVGCTSGAVIHWD
jgi:hypothetical protein